MPKVTQQPDPNRVQTRSKNANAHPGRAVMEALAVRRKPEDIEIEKQVKKERRKARAKKKADAQMAVLDIADFENNMAVDNIREETSFPRRQLEPEVDKAKAKAKKHKDRTLEVSTKASNSTNPHKRKSLKALELQLQLSAEIEKGIEESDGDKQQLKRRKTSRGAISLRQTDNNLQPEDFTSTRSPMPLRRTETYLQFEDVTSPRTGAMPLRRIETYLRPKDLMEGSAAIVDWTPMPTQKKGRVFEEAESEDRDSQFESEDSNFITPKALKRFASNSINDGATDNDSDTEEIISDGRASSQQSEYESDDRGSNVQKNSSRIDLTKMHKNATTKGKDKKAFRKEVEQRRALVAKGGKNEVTALRSGTKDSETSSTSSNRKISQPAHSKVTTVSRKETTVGGTTSNHTGHSAKSQPKPEPTHTHKAGLDVKYRTSATSGNAVGIIQSAHVGKEILKSKSKPNSVAGETPFNLSDEDDSTERAAILQSPPKGMQRLSSVAIVKVERSTSSLNETKSRPKSRSKGNILSPDTLAGWSKSVEPNFIYCYFYELRPWPTTNDIEVCAQKFWDWRFGDSYPLDLAESPLHVQLLNQKLCDIRTQSASSAIAILETEFRLSQDLDLLSGEEITALRQDHAQVLLDGKRFIFGKYVVAPDGTVRKSQPYQGSILLRTFTSSFKHIKDVRDDTDAPLPSSGYPKTLLAIAAAAVERALTLTIEGSYDFDMNKLIPKPDPNHPMKKSTTSMFAFSETVWEPRVELYLEKGVVKLKQKDWTNILNAASEYSNFIKISPTSKAKKPALMMEEELELAWDSESEEE